jgi:aldehyde:ferredoxin oxidoreductase
MYMGRQGIGGYAGTCLRVDLTHERISEVTFDEKTLQMYIGGTGLGSKILYDEVAPTIEWRHPDNRLIIASGPLGGTSIGGSGSISVITKGALTNGATSTQANGYFGAFLKRSGYDALILQGVAPRWLYLHLDQGVTELRDANHLLGSATYDTADRVKAELGQGDLQMSVVSIGPAGEHLVRFAGLFVDKGHAAAHNGTGAVMGSKRLKAIAVARGTRTVAVQDRARLVQVAQQFRDDPSWEDIPASLRDFRTTVGGVYNSHQAGLGTLPIKNYTTAVWEISEEQVQEFSEDAIKTRFTPIPHACWACRKPHSSLLTIPEGPFHGMLVEEPEYEQLAAWGPLIDNREVTAAVMLSGVCDRLGFDNNEAGWLIAWLMECYDRGYLTRATLGGLDVQWGNVDTVRQLLYLIAHRQGCGEWLAEGVMRASQRVGGAAAECAIYTLKGNTPRGHDHRTRWKEMFDTATSGTGTLETWMVTPARPELAGPGYPDAVAEYTASAKGRMIFEDSLVTCVFNTWTNLPLLVEAVNAATGWDLTEEEAQMVGRRAVNLFRVFNLRCGIGPELDYPSARYGSTPTDGPAQGIAIAPEWRGMLERYYHAMGWDVQHGHPLPDTLRRLGLDAVIADVPQT